MPEETTVVATIDWHFPENIINRYATNMLIQFLENDIKLSFFEVVPPLRLQDSDPIPTKVDANCVASIIIPREKFIDFTKAMNTQLSKMGVKL